MKIWLYLMIAVIFLESISDIFAKEWSLKYSNWLFGAALCGYVVTNLFWLLALKNGVGLTKGTVIFSVGSAILGVIIGLLFYKETLTNLQLIGVILGLIASVFIFWE